MVSESVNKSSKLYLYCILVLMYKKELHYCSDLLLSEYSKDALYKPYSHINKHNIKTYIKQE